MFSPDGQRQRQHAPGLRMAHGLDASAEGQGG